MKQTPARLRSRLGLMGMATILSVILSGCAVTPYMPSAPEPVAVAPGQAVIGIALDWPAETVWFARVSPNGVLGCPAASHDPVCFDRYGERTWEPQIYASHFRRGAYHYLVVPQDGHYVAVAARTASSTQKHAGDAGYTSTYTALYFPESMIEQTLARPRADQVTFLGRFGFGKLHRKMKKADPTQQYYMERITGPPPGAGSFLMKVLKTEFIPGETVIHSVRFGDRASRSEQEEPVENHIVWQPDGVVENGGTEGGWGLPGLPEMGMP
ncbi:MAG: hypothetical protein ACE5FN_06645 [Leptospirillia bacterium]